MAEKSRIASTQVGLGAGVRPGHGAPGARPMRMVWVGPLLGADASPAPIAIDKAGFRELMSAWRPRLALEVPNRLGGATRTLEVALEFTEPRSFQPDDVAQAVPEIRGLLAVRATLGRLIDEPLELDTVAQRLVADGADPEWARRFQRALEQTRRDMAGAPEPRSARAAGNDRLGGILDMVALPGQTSVAASDPFERLVRTVAGATGRQRRAEKSLSADVMAQLDAVIGPQVDAIVHAPEFLALESAWRGLQLLVERIDFRKGIVLEVLAAPPEAMVDALRRHVADPELEASRSPALTVIWVDREFDATARDVAALGELARIGESLQVPVVTAVGPAFFGVRAAQQLADLSPLWDHLRRPEYIPFGALRDEPGAAYLGLTFPRILGRMPHGPQGRAVRGFEWAEPTDEPAALPWLRGVAGLAARVAASQAESGWPAAITGAGGGGLIEDLPVASFALDESRRAIAPLDAVLPESMLEELEEAGFTVLSARSQGDQAVVHAAPVVARPKAARASPQARVERRENTLAYRMVAAQVAGAVRDAAARVRAGADAEGLRSGIEESLRTLLGLEGDRLAVAIEPAETPGAFAVGLHVRTPAVVQGAEVALDLAIELRV
jgi:type VI secretion system ImpC/EvpB family protein